MQFKVPQFIDVEDKIFGPLTFKQFLYLAGGAAVSFVLWKILPPIIAVMFITVFAGLSLALAFVRINNKPFIEIMEAFFKYSTGTRIYVWKKEPKRANKENMVNLQKDTQDSGYVPKLSGSKLKDLSWSLDVLDANKK